MPHYLFPFPVRFDRVVFAEGGDQVIGMLFSDVLNAEIVNDEREADWVGVVFPESRG